jgi:hypothetical protein
MMDEAEQSCATLEITGVESGLIGAAHREHNNIMRLAFRNAEKGVL